MLRTAILSRVQSKNGSFVGHALAPLMLLVVGGASTPAPSLDAVLTTARLGRNDDRVHRCLCSDEAESVLLRNQHHGYVAVK